VTTEKLTGLDLLRVPFPANQISKLPKETKAQREKREGNMALGIRCQLCGGWHHKDAVHLDYVGHAALTDRLLDCDAYWNWEPLAFTPEGLPAMDKMGGLWIKLTVADHTRLGYGHADGKTGGDAIKEAIGDALRNAAMRFGAALDLWHKGDLHGDDDASPKDDPKPRNVASEQATADAIEYLAGADDLPDLKQRWDNLPNTVRTVQAVIAAKEARKVALSQPKPAADLGGDELPY
jgi:hypothetical protein